MFSKPVGHLSFYFKVYTGYRWFSPPAVKNIHNKIQGAAILQKYFYFTASTSGHPLWADLKLLYCFYTFVIKQKLNVSKIYECNENENSIPIRGASVFSEKQKKRNNYWGNVLVCESGSLVLLVSIKRFDENYKCVGHTSRSQEKRWLLAPAIHLIRRVQIKHKLIGVILQWDHPALIMWLACASSHDLYLFVSKLP